MRHGRKANRTHTNVYVVKLGDTHRKSHLVLPVHVHINMRFGVVVNLQIQNLASTVMQTARSPAFERKLILQICKLKSASDNTSSVLVVLPLYTTQAGSQLEGRSGCLNGLFCLIRKSCLNGYIFAGPADDLEYSTVLCCDMPAEDASLKFCLIQNEYVHKCKFLFKKRI